MSDRPAVEAASQAGQYGNDMSAQARRRMQVPSIITGVNGMGDNSVASPGGVEMQFTPLLPSQLLLGSPFQTGTPQTGFGQFPGAFNQQNPAAALSPTAYNSGGIVSPTAFTPQYATFFPQQSPTVGSPLPAGMVSGTSRTVYLGNIPDETSAEEILGHVRSGPIESVRLLPDKNCAFISFLDGSSATHFHSDAILKKLSIKGQDIKIGWGKPSQVPTSVALAVQQSGASRNVYLGNLPEDITEEELRTDLGKFGAIDTVKLVKEKNIGFVHFLSIGNAIKAVTQLPQETKWQAPRRVYYGKDRCAYVSKTQQQNAAQYLGINPSMAHALSGQDREVISNAIAQQSVAAAAVATSAGGYNNLGNRTVYLGNIHPETTIEEICNVVRGGLLHHIRYIADKHICFVTFIDPTAAASFYALSNLQGLMIHNRRLKIGWGKHSGALPPAIALAVSGGASRNVYIGNLDETWTEERLRQDFSEYGEIELVNTLREKSCAFVNFTNIANAIKAIEAIRGKEDYRKFKINFGKDRCGNAPRQNAPGVQVNGAEQSPNGLNNGAASHHSGSPTSQPALSPSPNSMQQQAQTSYITTNPLHAYLAQQQQQQEAAAYNAAIQQLSAYQPENGAANGAANGNGQIPANGNNNNLGLPRSSSHNRAVSLPVLSLMGGNSNGNQNGHSFGMPMGGSNAWPENE
ncbi:uncharacterized protein DFL_003938 [Arthrobotrys flagrans]|uniref:RRM domain-containing protein n=1 Tax=Arthrobotrys flagrans TaxID=97331 RepID=A0A437A3A6_ARTFL|nr:hypothetical protein DFL_003938 [Arthrobotrys flagrans]